MSEEQDLSEEFEASLAAFKATIQPVPADEGRHFCHVEAGHGDGLTLDTMLRIQFCLDLTLPNGSGDMRYVSLSVGDIEALKRLLAREEQRLKIEQLELEVAKAFEERYGRSMRINTKAGIIPRHRLVPPGDAEAAVEALASMRRMLGNVGLEGAYRNELDAIQRMIGRPLHEVEAEAAEAEAADAAELAAISTDFGEAMGIDYDEEE